MTFENINLRCKDCRFWWPTAEGTGHDPSRDRSLLGQCRRRSPPAASVDKPDYDRHYPSWATTKREDWCGEHEHILH
jgi:hypothetical protein